MRPSLVVKHAAALKSRNPPAFLQSKLENGLTVVSQEKNGAVSELSSFATRDVFGVRISVARDQAPYALQILGHVAAKPAFKPWEIEDITPTILADLSQKTPYNIVIEDIHHAAFRSGSLSHSLYSPKSNVGTYKSEELSQFASKHFVNGNGVLVGVNVDEELLKNYAEGSGVVANGSVVKSRDSKFRGGDYRRFCKMNGVHIIVAGPGAAVGDIKKQAVQAVFLAHIGRVSPLKFATLPGSKTQLGLSSKLPEGVAGSGFNLMYEDTGIVGVYLIASGANADASVRATVEALKAPKVQELDACKKRAINEILFNAENNLHSAYGLATTALFTNSKQIDLIAEIQKVQSRDIEEFAKTTFERLAISAYGNCAKIPYSDEI
ncbi:CBN-UCR-2.3 protein [Caenorhabditis brenneri]|uniref:CBN-UCR-2.3 protein n=1 Tax=Caenorhabditis brenneri TaxID=135651 RepID=G0MYT3_CAEBE|nr:CBN-UCR-2.3 protein [Caenorhabditis brenneri]